MERAVVDRPVGRPVLVLEVLRVRDAGVGDLVVADGGQQRRLREQVVLLLEPDAPEVRVLRVHHHVAGVQRELGVLGGGGADHQRVVAGVAAVVAVDHHLDGAFAARGRCAGEDAHLASAFDAVAVLRLRLQRGQRDAVLDRRPSPARWRAGREPGCRTRPGRPTATRSATPPSSGRPADRAATARRRRQARPSSPLAPARPGAGLRPPIASRAASAWPLVKNCRIAPTLPSGRGRRYFRFAEGRAVC